MRRLASLLSLLTVGALGCVEAPEAQLGSAEQASVICPKWECGSNSPHIASFGFHELNVNGLMNAEGFSVISLWKAGMTYQLDVDRGRILGRAGSLTIAGSALQDAQIRVRHGAKSYAIRISQVSTIQSFAKLGGSPRPIETYLLEVGELIGSGLPTRWQNLCSNPPPYHSPDLLGINGFHTAVFEGERINADAKQINTAINTDWVNFACAGSALWKLVTSGLTHSMSAAYGFNTTILERQTALRMVTGAYCPNNGASFTVAGQPLQWRDSHGYTQYVSSPMNLELEARWTPNGVKCLNTPRVDANPTALGASKFPNGIQAEIIATCGALPPSCAGGVDDFDGTSMISANPL